ARDSGGCGRGCGAAPGHSTGREETDGGAGFSPRPHSHTRHGPGRVMSRRSAVQAPLDTLVEDLRACTICPKMHRPAVSGGAVVSRVMSVGQAPGTKEPILGRPFAWTAGKTLFKWFQQACGISEEEFRARIYMAAV